MRTPIPVAVCFFVGLLTTSALTLPGWALASLGFFALAPGLWASAAGWLPPASHAAGVSRPRLSASLLCLAALGAGLGFGPVPAPQHRLPPAGVARLTVDVESVRHGRLGEGRSRVRVLEGERLADAAQVAPGTVLWAGPFALPQGAIVRMAAAVAPQVRFRNLTPHPPLPNAHPAIGRARLPSADAYQVLEHAWFPRLLHDVRARIRLRLNQTLDEETAAVAAALTLGDPDTLEAADDDAVRASGMAHVFAVSGMHITLIAGVAVTVLGYLLTFVYPLAARCDVRRIACAIGIPLALSISELTGGSPSGYRASITSALSFLLIALGQRPHAGAVTAGACLLFAIVEPLEALRPAFLLSIAATAAILTALNKPMRSVREVLMAALVLSVRTSLATAPIVLWSFGSVAFVGVLANVLLVPIGNLLLVLAAVHAALACMLPVLTVLSAAPLTIVSRGFLFACTAFADSAPGVTWPLLSSAQGLSLAIAVALGLCAARVRTRLYVTVAALVAVLALEVHLRHVEQPRGGVRVTFLDVGQGDCALIDLPDGRVMLIDGGGNPSGGADPGAASLLPLLRARRRDHIDVMVLTHPHPDHYGGLRAVLETLSVGELWDSGQGEAEAELSSTAREASELLAAARARGVRVLGPQELCEAPRHFGAARVAVLWPCPRYDSGFDANDNSLVLRLDLGRRSFLFSGDIEEHAERALVEARAPLDADVLKVAHHGSRTSSAQDFLSAVTPVLSVVSAGAHNPFGHPHADVTERLRASSQRVADIGQSGSAMVATDGERLTLRTWAAPSRVALLQPEASPETLPGSDRSCAPAARAATVPR